jgi:hypothetical protein
VIHLGNNDSIFPDPNAAERATDEECARCIEEGRPWPENNRYQDIDQCLHYLNKIISSIKPGLRLINVIFVPPVLPPVEHEHYRPGVMKRSHERSAFYMHKMIEFAKSKGCEIVGMSGSPRLQEREGIMFGDLGQVELADELKSRIDNAPVQSRLNRLQPL